MSGSVPVLSVCLFLCCLLGIAALFGPSFAAQDLFRLRSDRLCRPVRLLRRLTAQSGIRTVSFAALCLCAPAGGWLIGRIMFGTVLLSAACAAAAAVIPLLFLEFLSNRRSAEELDRLETALTLVTNDYLAGGNISAAVEDNLPYLRDFPCFAHFVSELRLIDPDPVRALRRMRARTENSYFRQWIDTVLASQENRSMRSVLPDILREINEARTDRMETETAMASVWREYLVMLCMICAIPAVFRLVLYDWFALLTGTAVGQLLVMLLLAAIVWSFRAAMRINAPVQTEGRGPVA